MKFYEALKTLEEGKTIIRSDFPMYIKTKEQLCIFISKCSNEQEVDKYINGEWDIFEHPCIGFQEMIIGLKQGKAYRRKSWGNESFYMIYGHFTNAIIFSDYSKHILTIDDFMATDWVCV